MRQKALSKHVDFAKAKTLELISIPWTKIATKIGTKSKDDCRNRWYTQVFNTLHDQDQFSETDQLKLVKAIKRQEADSEKDIDFTEIGNGRTEAENKYQWQKLKKIVSSRCDRPVSDVAKELIVYFKAQEPSKKYTVNPQETEENNSSSVDRHSLLRLYREKAGC